MNEKKKSEKGEEEDLRAHFRVSGKITKLLGRESVSESITALFEVLKNSHDADAISATIEFKNFASGAGKIILKEEDGDGMTEDEIRNKFFVIGTYSKVNTEGEIGTTKLRKRRMLGSKGVGRFALERLGKEVKIISKPRDSMDQFTFEIDWKKFEPQEVTVDQVGVDIIPGKREKKEDCGLEIEISQLRDNWNELAIKKLEGKIQRLILPKEFQPINSFRVYLDAPEFGYNKKLIKVDLLERSYYYLKAELLDDRIKLVARIKNKTVIGSQHKNDIITEFTPYEHGATITSSEKKQGIKYVKDLTCGPVTLIVHYFPIFQRNSIENRDAIRYYGEMLGLLIDSELPKHSGVRIFRDGMREFTYGDPNNDWVERASISRNLSGTIQADRLIGYVLISSEKNKEIIPTTNRETAIQNQAFIDLREFAIQSMKSFDVYLNKERRRELEARKDLKKDQEAINQLQVIKQKLSGKGSNITKAFQKVRDLTGQDYSPEIDRFLDAVDSAQGRLEEKIESAKAMMTENQIQRSLASLGVLVSMMIHEINDSVSIAHRESTRLQKHTAGNNKLSTIELKQLSYYLNTSMMKIKTWNDLVDRFSNSLTLEDIRSRTEDTFKPYQVVEQFVSNVMKILSIPYIEIKNDINSKLEIKMFAAYFESIVGNLISNSIKAINAIEDKQKRQNKILIKSEKTDQHLIIYFSDNGIGIPKERWDVVFEPHISSTTRFKIMKGHGLGLPIVHSMLKEYDGEIEIVDPILGNGTTFRITLPWKSIDPKG